MNVFRLVIESSINHLPMVGLLFICMLTSAMILVFKKDEK